MFLFHRAKLLSLVLIPFLLSPSIYANEQGEGKPRLVLQITVDGLRGDLIHRYRAGFGSDGFNYLLDNGTYYSNAYYQHANTETIVGHTILATGAQPRDNGMTGNVWYDRNTRELSYNIEDPDAPILPSRDIIENGDQVDPAQQLARTDGRSPRAILVPTLADTMAAYYAGKASIFAVSSKDRSAVSMGGQAGKAFWYSTDTGDFVTSRYYYEEYPAWVQGWNQNRAAEKFAGAQWDLSSDFDDYLLSGHDDRPYELDMKGYGRVFPHQYGDLDNTALYTQIIASPVGDELLLDFAKTLMVNESLGQDNVPDYLSISFSGVDAVNHFFGPSSLENEEVVRRLDNTLAELFDFIDKNIGLKNTLIILSADHGMGEMPEYMTELGYDAGRLDPKEIIKFVNKLGKQLGVEEVVRLLYRPYLYLDEQKIAAANLDYHSIVDTIAEALTKYEGINLAVSANQLQSMDSPLVKKIRNNHHPERSGDIYIVQEPYWFMFDGGPIPATHGSPWRYDSHVPIIFSGSGIPAQSISRQVQPADVAPTIAALLGMVAPAASQGKVLYELSAKTIE